MKRTTATLHPDLFGHYGWFEWQKCERCASEFRREPGWRYLSGPFHGGQGRWLYLCFSCGGPTAITATECIAEIDQHRRDQRPAPPPMPPPCRWIRTPSL